ncbi:hypothetical protein EPH_0072770 [Eimeria praecox]|uniref:Uncharacterized protein n=1 Tax=Eimeria praecox TaxID=51316 RepID=U6H872_9EIME|nr:hypothetical protein EPH_0072770 [Eimeria praecox]
MRSSGDQQRQETLKLSLPLTKTRELADSSMMSIPYADQATWNRLAYPTHHNRPARSRLPNLSLHIFLATTISVVAVLISLSICNSLRGKGQGSGLTRRKLAEGDARIDADELSIVEGCLELEEEMGILQQRAVSSSQGDSSSRVTELVSMLSEAAAAKGSMQEGLYVDNQLHQQFLEGHSGFQPRVA